jgi:hypothetical protein
MGMKHMGTYHTSTVVVIGKGDGKSKLAIFFLGMNLFIYSCFSKLGLKD